MTSHNGSDGAGPAGPANPAKDVPSALMRQTLLDRRRVRSGDAAAPPVRLLPWLEVVVIGGRSIIDRGRDVVAPLVEEIRTLLPEHRMLLLTGAGIRARHVLGVGLDLGLPTGALAGLAATEAEQNGHLLASLLAADGVSYLARETVARQLPVHLAAAPAAVSCGYPPYGVHEFPPSAGRLPVHRTDAGSLLLADAFGAARLVYVRDANALAPVAGRDTVDAAALAQMSGDLPIDRVALGLLARTKHVQEVRIVDGTARGALTDALADKPTGITITK